MHPAKSPGARERDEWENDEKNANGGHENDATVKYDVKDVIGQFNDVTREHSLFFKGLPHHHHLFAFFQRPFGKMVYESVEYTAKKRKKIFSNREYKEHTDPFVLRDLKPGRELLLEVRSFI